MAKATVCKTVIRGFDSHPGLLCPGGGTGIHERLKIS